MKKLLFFYSCLASLLAYGQSSTRPNIILIVADDLGWADLGCYGNRYIHTPHLDSLARMGKLFRQAYAAAPVCSPSRAAMLTGKYPARLKFTQYAEGKKGDTASRLLPADFVDALPDSETTLAQMLGKAGYATGMAGKWHLGKADQAQPGKHGFAFERVAQNGITYYDFKLSAGNRTVYESAENEHLTDRLTAEAVDFMESNRQKPFFLYLAHFAPHLVMQPKPQKLPRYYFTYNKLSQGRFDPQYAATVEGLDDSIGQIMGYLRKNNLLDNTVIIFTSDNGGVSVRELGVKPTDNWPLRAGKGHLYEGGIRVPMLAVWPGKIKPGSQTEQLVVLTDLLSTLADIAGVAPGSLPAQDGQSFAALLNEKVSNEKVSNEKVLSEKTLKKPARTVFWHYPHFSNQGGRPSAAVRQGDWKLIVHYETEQAELYNISKDVSETDNLIATQPKKAEQLKRLLLDWQHSVNANMPRPNPAKQ
jgi:arylsulfatase A-like enzyme